MEWFVVHACLVRWRRCIFMCCIVLLYVLYGLVVCAVWSCPPAGLRRVCRHLPGNYMITDLVLANARITSRGLRYLCDALTFMDNLFYLDLSQNCIDDLGMEHLSDLLGEEGHLSSCPSLRKVTLLGNRITYAGAKLVATSALSGNLEYLKYVHCTACTAAVCTSLCRSCLLICFPSTCRVYV